MIAGKLLTYLYLNSVLVSIVVVSVVLVVVAAAVVLLVVVVLFGIFPNGA